MQFVQSPKSIQTNALKSKTKKPKMQSSQYFSDKLLNCNRKKDAKCKSYLLEAFSL